MEKIQKKYSCVESEIDGKKIVLGPSYPSEYYRTPENQRTSGAGFFMGYWMGRSLTNSVYHSSSGTVHHGPDMKSFHSSNKSSSTKSSFSRVSRGGFGSSARGSIGG